MTATTYALVLATLAVFALLSVAGTLSRIATLLEADHVLRAGRRLHGRRLPGETP